MVSWYQQLSAGADSIRVRCLALIGRYAQVYQDQQVVLYKWLGHPGEGKGEMFSLSVAGCIRNWQLDVYQGHTADPDS